MDEPSEKAPGEMPETKHLLRLAWSLVEDSQQAEDVVQDALMRSLGRIRELGGRTNAYLRITVENGVRKLWRDRERRYRRELDGARSERVPSFLAELETNEFRSILAEAIGALGEPYRSTIQLRFFEDLSPREIAQRKGLPDSTVRSHLKRGLRNLREGLDQRFGRRTWMGGFAAVLRRETGSAPVAPPLAAAIAKVALFSQGGLTVLGAALLATTLAIWPTRPADARAPVLSDSSARIAWLGDGAGRPETRDSIPVRGVVPGPSASPSDETASRAAGRTSTPAPADPPVDPDENGILLHVRNQETGQPLADVLVLRATADTTQHPGPRSGVDSVLVEHASSPFLLPSDSSALVQYLWVTAPGHAWQRLNVARDEDSRSGERRLFLEAGGDLRVHVHGRPSLGAPTLWVRDSSGNRILEVPIEDDVLELEGLPLGALTLHAGYASRVWNEERWDQRFVVREADLILGTLGARTEPGRWTDVDLVLADAPDPAPLCAVTLSLAVPVDPTFAEVREQHRAKIHVRPLEAATRESFLTRFERSSLSVELDLSPEGIDLSGPHQLSLPQGLYELELWPLCQRQVVRVEEGAALVVTPGPVAEVVLDLPEGFSGDLLFQPLLLEPHAAMASLWAIDAERHTSRALLAPGRYRVKPYSAGRNEANTGGLEVELHAGWNAVHFDASLAQAATPTVLEIELFCDGLRVPLHALPFSIRALGHDGVAYHQAGTAAPEPGAYLIPPGWYSSAGDRDVLVKPVFLSRPGAYELGAFTLPSFAPFPGRRVDAVEGERLRIRIELEPAK